MKKGKKVLRSSPLGEGKSYELWKQLCIAIEGFGRSKMEDEITNMGVLKEETPLGVLSWYELDWKKIDMIEEQVWAGKFEERWEIFSEREWENLVAFDNRLIELRILFM